MNNFELENWLPMGPQLGPPLPRFLNIYWPWYKPAPPAEPREVAVALKNPPSDAAKWLISILDYAVSDYQSSGAKSVTEPATFEVEQDWFPLRIEIRIEGAGGVRIYHTQSFSTAEPDYKETFIPDYGSYYYNVSAERFEKV